MGKPRELAFESLNIHSTSSKSNEDHAKTPWIYSSRIKERHGKPIYCCAFNNYLPRGSTPVFATASERFVHIYECPLDSNAIALRDAFHDESVTEQYFALSWCYDEVEQTRGGSPYMIAVAGHNSHINIIDPTQMVSVNLLMGHGGCVNEIRTSPGNPSIIASASKDTTVRVWHVRSEVCLVVIGGHDAHRDQVLSTDWSPCGKFLMSGSMDHTIRLWNFAQGSAHDLVDKVSAKLSNGKRNCWGHGPIDLDKTEINRKKLKSLSVADTCDQTQRQYDRPITTCFPAAINSDLHDDYVDCVRFIGSYCVSKGAGSGNNMMIFRFGGPGETLKDKEALVTRPETCALMIMEKHVPGTNHTWFIKLDIDPRNKYIACGSGDGKVHFWDLRKFNTEDPSISIDMGRHVIRQVAFEAEGRILVATGDDGCVNRCDRVSAEVVKPPKFDIVFGPLTTEKERPLDEDVKKDELEDEEEVAVHELDADSAAVRVRGDMRLDTSCVSSDEDEEDDEAEDEQSPSSSDDDDESDHDQDQGRGRLQRSLRDQSDSENESEDEDSDDDDDNNDSYRRNGNSRGNVVKREARTNDEENAATSEDEAKRNADENVENVSNANGSEPGPSSSSSSSEPEQGTSATRGDVEHNEKTEDCEENVGELKFIAVNEHDKMEMTDNVNDGNRRKPEVLELKNGNDNCSHNFL